MCAPRGFYNFCLCPLILARFKELYAAPKDQYFAQVFVSNSLAYCEIAILGRFSCIWPLKLEYSILLQQNDDFCKFCTKNLHSVEAKPPFFFLNGTPLQQNNGFSRTTKPDRPSIWGEGEIKVLHVFSWKFRRFCMIFNAIPGSCPNQWFLNKAVNSELTSPRSGSWMPEKHKNHELCPHREY